MDSDFVFLSDAIGQIFSSPYLEEIARETEFFQREGKLKACGISFRSVH